MLRCYITDMRALSGEAELLANIARVAERIDLLQVREKHLHSRALAALVRLVLLRVPAGVRVLVNDRADIAIACGAHGVQLRSNSLSPVALRQIAPRGFTIGVSCHSLEDVQRACNESADFALLAPIFDSPGKGNSIGLAALREAARATPLPILALGGVTVERFSECLEAGAAGIAGIRLFQASS